MCKKLLKIFGGECSMADIQFDNVFSSNVNEDYVEIKAAFYDDGEQKKEKITDDDVKNIKSIKMQHNDYAVFLRAVLTAAVKLEREFTVDLGLNLKKKD